MPRNLLIWGQTSCASAPDGLQTTTQGLGNLGGVALAQFCHPDPLPRGSHKPVPATSSFKPLLGRVLRLSGLHNCSTMGTQGPNIVPPSAHGHYVPIFMGLPCPQGPWGIFVQVVPNCHLMRSNPPLPKKKTQLEGPLGRGQPMKMGI